jgi:glycosyltransferase involved in cell wall biosynthesis
MKILMVSEDVPRRKLGGLARHAVTLASVLSRNGHDVDFMGNNREPFEKAMNDIEITGNFFPELNMKNLGWKESMMGIFNPLRRPYIARRLARAIMQRARDYDVVHYHGHFPLLANHIPKEINFVQTRHDQGSDCLAHIRFRNHAICRETSPFICAECATSRPNAVQRLISASAVSMYRHLTARAFRRHKTIFVSELLRKNFCRTAGEGPWGRVIHNFWDSGAAGEHCPTRSTDHDRMEVFIAGKIYEAKGIISFLEHIQGKIPQKMHITIAGDGKYGTTILRQRFVGTQVKHLGWLSHSDTIKHMASCDIVVVPSICEEAFGLVTLEGLSLGKQVFALNRGATPELKKYQRFSEQLLLFDNMTELVNRLVNFRPYDLQQTIFADDFAAFMPAVIEDIVNVYGSNRLAG